MLAHVHVGSPTVSKNRQISPFMQKFPAIGRGCYCLGRCRCNKIRKNIFVSIGNGMRINSASSSGEPESDPRRYDASLFHSRHYSFLFFILSLSRFFSSSTFTRSRALASFTRAIKSATVEALSAARETWTRYCLPWQRNKVTRHVSSPFGTFKALADRFKHIHVDIIVMQYSQGYRYCLMCIDRFSRWPEAVPIANMEAPTVASALLSTWIARFGVSLKIMIEQGRQFESRLFEELCRLLGIKHLRTTAYHPASNGMVERLHRQLKAAIKCHDTSNWVEILPIVLLGIKTAIKDDLNATAAEMIYGTGIQLPAEFFLPNKQRANTSGNTRTG